MRYSSTVLAFGFTLMGCRDTVEPVAVGSPTTLAPVGTTAPEVVITTVAAAPRIPGAEIILDEPFGIPVGNGVVLRTPGAAYHVRSSLGRGAAGEVFLVERSTDRQQFALKRAPTSDSSAREIDAYRTLAGQLGFPQLVDVGEEAGWTYIVLTRIGRRIEDIRTRAAGRLFVLPVEAGGSIAIQMIERLQTLHGLGFVHLDMYPNNIAVGIGAEATTLYLFDFGEARRDLQNRREDIRSLSHSVLQLLRPGTRYGDYKHYEDDRDRPSLADLCQGLPEQVLRLFEYSHTLLGSEEPDYAMLRSLMLEMVPGYSGHILW